MSWKIVVQVVVGILFNEANEVLIALRPPQVVQPGVWEFPGGKVEDNETLEEALIREYQEEIGIRIHQMEFLLKIEKNYFDKTLVLHVFRIDNYIGAPRGAENQEIRFVPIPTLKNYTFPTANAEIIAWLSHTETER